MTLATLAPEPRPKFVTHQLEAWFGVPYPYAKLDLVAVPSFSSRCLAVGRRRRASSCRATWTWKASCEAYASLISSSRNRAIRRRSRKSSIER